MTGLTFSLTVPRTVAATAVRTTGVTADEAGAWRRAVEQALAGDWPPERG